MIDTVSSDEAEQADLLTLVAYVTGSTYREKILRELQNGPKQPSQLADEVEIARPHTSRTLSELSERDLVRSHSTDSRAKLYTSTDRGTAVAERIPTTEQ